MLDSKQLFSARTYIAYRLRLRIVGRKAEFRMQNAHQCDQQENAKHIERKANAKRLHKVNNDDNFS